MKPRRGEGCGLLPTQRPLEKSKVLCVTGGVFPGAVGGAAEGHMPGLSEMSGAQLDGQDI